MSEWTEEDDKLVTLARGARARVAASSGAALRDSTGRTYSATNVSRGPLEMTAIELVTGVALSSGSTGIEAVVIVADDVLVTAKDIDVIEAAGGVGVPVHVFDNSGTLLRTLYS
ncbi:MAG: cytidine deaminase [Actinobacteria bacterium]|nr:cytidine deaminase [Actinomycetota bacterium]